MIIPLGGTLLGALISDLPGSSGAPSRPALPQAADPSLFGLAPCGVCPARDIAIAAVRSYRTFSPLPGVAAKAVCFLWHLPSNGLEPALPDVIRHTALRSSDFPLPNRERPSGPAAILFIIFDQPSCAVLPASSHDR